MAATVGGMLRTETALTSADGAHLLVASGATVRVYSTVTAERLLLLTGHAADVTAICRHPKSDTQVYTASLDGTIKLWDYADAAVQQTWSTGEAIEGMVLPNRQVAVLCCRSRPGGSRSAPADTDAAPGASGAPAGPPDADAGPPSASGAAGRVLTYSFVQKKVLSERAVKLSAPGPLVASPDGAFVATIDRNSLIVLCLDHPQSKPMTLHHTKALTCVAIDASSTHIAAGDAQGRILIWSGLPQAAAAAATGAPLDARTAGMTATTVHWHAHAVGALAFSPDGAYLLSGGREAVLVIWQLETLKRTYLPRLGGPITHIAPCAHDAARYAVCQERSAIRLVALSTMLVESSIYGVRPPPLGASPDVGTACATMQPGSGYLVIPCRGAQLQFYDVSKDRHIARLTVVPRNLTSPTEELKEGTTTAGAGGLLEPAVTHVAFSHDATVMATVEVRPDSGAGDASSALKFWDANAAALGPAAYDANTVVDDPHAGTVAALAFQPGQFVAVTTGVGRGDGAGEFRVWMRQPRRRTPGAPPGAAAWHWRCRSVGSYKGLPMGCCAFSQDGSVLAVAAGPHITLWHPATNALMAVLSDSTCCGGGPVTRLLFASQSHYLVAAYGGARRHLASWNLLTLSLWWALAVDVVDVAADPREARVIAVFAAAPGKGDGAADSGGDAVVVAEMAADAPTAVRTWSSLARVCKVLHAPPGSALSSRAAAAAARPLGGAPVLVIAQDRRMMLLPDAGGAAAPPPQEAARLERVSAEATTSGYSAVYGALPSSDAAVKVDADAGDAAMPQALNALFDVPSHLLPSASVLCGQMLRLMLSTNRRRA